MQILSLILVGFLILCALAAGRTKDLVSAVVIFASYSLIMAVLWLMLQSPDVAMTEAAIGAGVTTIMFVAVISRTSRIEK